MTELPHVTETGVPDVPVKTGDGITRIILVTELELKQPSGSVAKLLFLTLNLTKYKPPVVGKVWFVVGVVVMFVVPSPQSH